MQSADSLSFSRQLWSASSSRVNDSSRLVLEHYDREQIPLRRYLVFLGLDPETAEELVQESFLKLHEHLLAGGDGTNLRAWLYRVAHNLCRNSQLSFRSSKTGPIEHRSGVDDPVSPSLSAEEWLLSREQTARLRDAIVQLNPAQKSCLVLRSQGFKYREMAEILNLSVSTVAENVQRGLETLRKML